MDVTKQYAIAWKGLKNGTYRFDFKVDNALFEAYGSTDIKDGDLSVGVTLELRRSGALPPCLPGVRFLPRQAGHREEGRRIIPAPERARCWIAARSFVPQTITNQRLKLC